MQRLVASDGHEMCSDRSGRERGTFHHGREPAAERPSVMSPLSRCGPIRAKKEFAKRGHWRSPEEYLRKCNDVAPDCTTIFQGIGEHLTHEGGCDGVQDCCYFVRWAFFVGRLMCAFGLSHDVSLRLGGRFLNGDAPGLPHIAPCSELGVWNLMCCWHVRVAGISVKGDLMIYFGDLEGPWPSGHIGFMDHGCRSRNSLMTPRPETEQRVKGHGNC